ncbi:lasso peptide biosynthesis PqqD family chaperone [Streptomyces sp. URMC 127]|uniref:lasso peptide biosynthesis PqqD family chaperone n=1 Tax=Streptomyces sp. URMC 127 TaxID=3423402 RepID=UPI003F1B2DC5
MSLALRQGVCATRTEDGMVLLDEVSGRYWQLNGTAARVLHTLLDGTPPEDAARRLREGFPQLSAQRADDDISSFLDALIAARLVVRV